MAYSLIALLFVPAATINSVSAQRTDENDLKFDRRRHLLRGTKAPCPVVPPFLAPFPLSDSDAFEAISSCPFLLHEQITGQEIGGCLPMYSIPYWDNSNSVSFKIHEFNAGTETPLFFERKSIFASWEDLSIVSTSHMSNLGKCIANLNYKVEGINGEISGENGTASLSAIVISFNEFEKENAILLPVGGCELDSHQSASHRNLDFKNLGDQAGRMMTRRNDYEEACSIRPDSIEWNECVEKCYTSTESNYVDEIDKLTTNRDKRISKNLENKETVLGKLLITRTTQLSAAFARCKCKHREQDLGQCLLLIFLDALVTENEHQFEVEKNFDHHTDEVETWFQSNRKLVCDTSTRAVVNCRNEC